MDKSAKIIKWFNEHGLISVHGICKLIDVKQHNFQKELDRGWLQEKHIPKLEEILKHYGYDDKEVL